MSRIYVGAACILPCAAGEGDRAKHGGGGCRSFGADRLLSIFSRRLAERGALRPLHHPSDGPPPPFHGGGYALAVIAAIGIATPAHAGDITITSPWLRAAPKNASVAGGYATITNKGATEDRLVGASIPMAPKGEIHSMSMANGIMHMQRLDKGLPIAPGATVELKPGGYHLMFVRPKGQIKEGDEVKGTLTFEKAGAVPVTFPVAGFGAKAAPTPK